MNGMLRQLLGSGKVPAWMLLAAVFAFAAALAGIGLLALSGWLITAAALSGAGLIATVEIFAPGAGIRAAALGRTVGRYLDRLIGHEATFRQLAELRVHAFRRLLGRPVAQLERVARGDTMNRLTRDIDVLDHFIPSLVLPTGAAIAVTIAGIAGLSWLDATLGWIVASTFLLSGSGILLIGSRLARRPGRRLARATPAMRSALTEWLEALAVLLSIGRSAERAEAVMVRVDAQLQSQWAQRRVEAAMQAGLAAVGYFGFWLVLVLALGLADAGQLSAALAAAAALVALGLVDVWQGLAQSWSFLETCRQASIRVGEVTSSDPERAERSVHSVPDCSLSFEATGFRYPRSLEPVLRDIDLRVEPGERVLIHGPSGVGKTTLGKIAAGILHPTEGNACLGGVAMHRLTRDTLRSRVGYLSQDAVLFEDSVRANLTLDGSRPDSARLKAILEALSLNELIESLPDGLDSWIGNHGNPVSGGEARRLAMARTLLPGFPVLILDEPTAGVDPSTAASMAEALDHLLAGISVVVFSHDRGMLPKFDRELELSGWGLRAR
jgi:ATP-binding cassette subfamily C protein CydC